MGSDSTEVSKEDIDALEPLGPDVPGLEELDQRAGDEPDAPVIAQHGMVRSER